MVTQTFRKASRSPSDSKESVNAWRLTTRSTADAGAVTSVLSQRRETWRKSKLPRGFDVGVRMAGSAAQYSTILPLDWTYRRCSDGIESAHE